MAAEGPGAILSFLLVILSHLGHILGPQGAAGAAAVKSPGTEELVTSLVVNQLAIIQIMKDASNASIGASETCAQNEARREEEALRLVQAVERGQQRHSQETLETIRAEIRNVTRETVTAMEEKVQQDVASGLAAVNEEVRQVTSGLASLEEKVQQELTSGPIALKEEVMQEMSSKAAALREEVYRAVEEKIQQEVTSGLAAVNEEVRQVTSGLASLKEEVMQEVSSTVAALREEAYRGVSRREELRQDLTRMLQSLREEFLMEKNNLINVVKSRTACPSDWRRYGSSCYRYEDTERSWADSRAYCRAIGGDLVKITSDGEHEFIKAHLLVKDVWIGLNDRGREGRFVWTDGSLPTYTAWNSGQPDDHGRGEDCVYLDSDNKKWNDYECSDRTSGAVCERPVNA